MKLQGHDNVWKYGMRIIRRIFKNQLPENLEQVIGFMTVAKTMRSSSKISEDTSQPLQDFQTFP